VTRHVVCRRADLPPGERRVVEVGGLSIGVFNVDGRFHALLNRCPHKAAPLCLGVLSPLVVADEPYEYRVDPATYVIRCPWHGWEFDVATGRSVFNPHRVRVRSYPVTLEREQVHTFPVTLEDDLVVVDVRAI
jgi:3-phenylpropionate/trans-cinnamate dioxygenase ferredoxin subunit